MASIQLYTLLGSQAIGTNRPENHEAWRYDLESGLWYQIASPPFSGMVNSESSNIRQVGAWDGNEWFVITPASGTLYAYRPLTNSWRGPLASGVVVHTGSFEDVSYELSSDGRYLYWLSGSNDFRRYDPVTDRFTQLAPHPGAGSYGGRIFCLYDGDDTFYATKGFDLFSIYSYSITSDVWTALPVENSLANLANSSVNAPVWAEYMGGKLVVLHHQGGLNSWFAFQYNPAGSVWTTGGSGTLVASTRNALPSHMQTDTTLRIWNGAGASSYIYDMVAHTLTAAAVGQLDFLPATGERQSQNACLSRPFSVTVLWYEADGTTPLSGTIDLGQAAVGEVLQRHLKVKSLVDRAAGVTIQVPVLVASDAEDVVTLCNTSGGTYATSFSSAALAANDLVDVYMKVTPTLAQTLGLDKTFSLKVIPN